MTTKKYHVHVSTPIGTETALLCFEDKQGYIEINKGSAQFNELFILDNKIMASLQTDVPFSCNVRLSAEMNNSEIKGYLVLDNYLTVEFEGKETDVKSIPGLR